MSRTWIYHRTNPARIVDTNEVDMDQLHADGWRDTPAAFDSPEPDAAELNLPVPEIPAPLEPEIVSAKRKK